MANGLLQTVIMTALVGEKIDLIEFKIFYLNVRFVKNIENNIADYCWIAESKISSINVWPMVNSQNVKVFKTLTGAKRNFLSVVSC